MTISIDTFSPRLKLLPIDAEKTSEEEAGAWLFLVLKLP
jgi:hypothetical protein